MIYPVAHVAEWEPQNLLGLAHVSGVGSVLHTDPAKYLITAE